MDIEKVKEKLYFLGFEQDLFADLDKQVAVGMSEITLQKSLKIDDIDVDYRLHIKNDLENQALYFNKFDLHFKLPNGEEREHTFSTTRMITAMEGFRMALHGDKVSVYKTLYKDDVPYNTWLSLSTDKPKDENGNFQYNSYHENYYKKEPFNIQSELKNLDFPVTELENQENLDRFEKSLKKAKLIPVHISVDGRRNPGFLGVNPEKGRLALYDVDLKLLVGNKQEIKSNKIDQATPQAEEVKKKPWEERKVEQKAKSQFRGKGI